MAHPAWLHGLFSDADLDAIGAAVARAERTTSAELRVHLEQNVPKARETLGRAQEVFRRLGMHKTRERNGVLIYLAVDDHKLAVVGDAGIHARVGERYWQEIRDLMVAHLRGHEPRLAVIRAVEELGRVLAEHFPRGPGDDPNELADEVSTQ